MNYKKLIKLDENKNIIDSKTDVFVTDKENWIDIGETFDRQWRIDLKKNDVYKYKYDKEIKEKTDKEIEVDLLPILKQRKCAEIVANSRRLCTQGYKHPDKDVIFSTSETAQRNWIFMLSEYKEGIMKFPYACSDIDDDEYLIKDEDELKMILFSGAAMIQGYKKSNRLLIAQVKAAKTIDDLSKVKDNRI